MDGAAPFRSSRNAGMARLLVHCEAVGRHGEGSSPAQTRLERALGLDLASRLVSALAPGPRGRTMLAL
jgi:hypothetical protein